MVTSHDTIARVSLQVCAVLTGTVGAERTFLGAGMGVVVLYLRRGGIVGETLQEEKCSLITPIVKSNVL